MKKSLFILPIALLLTSCVSSSFNGTKRGIVSSSNSNMVSSRYEYCNGSQIYTFQIQEHHALNIKCEIKTKSGEINFSISPKGKNSLFARSTTGDETYNVELPEYGTYRISINMNEHSGSYLFDWSR